MSDYRLTYQLREHDGDVEVRLESERGEARVVTAAPGDNLLKHIAAHDPVDLPDNVMQWVGGELYQILMAGEVGQLAGSVLSDAFHADESVHVELRFDPDQVRLTRFPWEMIRNRVGQFPVRDGLVDLTRYISYPQPPPAFTEDLSGYLLQVVASPEDMPPLVADPIGSDQLHRLEDAAFDDLMRWLLLERNLAWGLHFDGHGALRDLRGRRLGALAFERENRSDWVSTEELGSVLYNAQIRLVVLSACESAYVGDDLVFSGLAPGLILAGVPAVVGMQYPVGDYFMGRFAAYFYDALAWHRDVVTALRTARRMSVRSAWYSPVLYQRKRPKRQTASTTLYQSRQIDTAVPAEAPFGEPFLVRLWIRRPETEPLSEDELRDELDIPAGVPVRTKETGTEVRFDPVEGRRFRRGEVEVSLQSAGADVTPRKVKLFVDEHLDAPPAIFTVTPRRRRFALVFFVLQDGGQIATITHNVTATEGPPGSELQQESVSVGMEQADKHAVTLQQAMRLSGAERGVLLLKQATGEFVAKAGHLPENAHAVAGEVVRHTAETGEPIMTTNAQLDERFASSASVVSFGLRSITTVPIMDGDEVIGVIYLDNRLQSGMFSNATLETLQSFAGQASRVLQGDDKPEDTILFEGPERTLDGSLPGQPLEEQPAPPPLQQQEEKAKKRDDSPVPSAAAPDMPAQRARPKSAGFPLVPVLMSVLLAGASVVTLTFSGSPGGPGAPILPTVLFAATLVALVIAGILLMRWILRRR